MQNNNAKQSCPNCGAPVKPGSHFCAKCGASIESGLFCRQCGSLNSKTAKFCRACGTPLQTLPPPPPARMKNSSSGVTPDISSGSLKTPQKPAPANPAPPISIQHNVPLPPPKLSNRISKPGNIQLKNKQSEKALGGIIIVFVIIVAASMLMGETPPESPASDANAGINPYNQITGNQYSSLADTSTRDKYSISDMKPSPEDAIKRDKTVSDAADALSKGDEKTFLSLLTSKNRKKYGDTLGLSGAAASKLASALQGTRLKTEYLNGAAYELTINGKKYTFFVLKEDGKWKISGL